MRKTVGRILLVMFLACGTCAAQEVEYELKFGGANTHLLEIRVQASGLRGPSVEFAMPAWSPGWYIINDYAKMVQEFSAEDANGAALAWSKTDKQTWRVNIGTGKSVTVRYKLYGNTLAVDWVQYNDRHAHIAGPATWMYLVGGKERPARLHIFPPTGWRVATGMKPAGENSYTASDYDTFIDAPLEISDFAEKTFEAGGVKFHVIVHDVLGHKDFGPFVEGLQKTVHVLIDTMAPAVGGPRAAPFEEYWFLFHNWPRTGGGLEHLNSTQIFFSGDWVAPGGDGFAGQLNGSTHEFFHAWNVKRLRPKPLGPFDYSREVPTPSLWISEGLTNYYAALALLRAGLTTPEQYLEQLGRQISFFESLPGRRERSIEQTSFDTWFWYTGGGPAQTNQQNTDHSYYTGGQIIGNVLDLAIRNATGNQKSLDDWMRLLYTRYALPKPGFEPEDAVRAASEVAGRDMSDFFRRYVSDKETPPYEEIFAWAGIRTEKTKDEVHGWLGAQLSRDSSGGAVIGALAPQGPAEEAGLDRGDAVIFADGKTVNQQELINLLRGKKPRDRVRLVVNHLGDLRECTVTLRTNPSVNYTFRLEENPTEMQRKIYESWVRGK